MEGLMKKLVFIIILVVAVVCLSGIRQARADFIQPLNQVAFWVYDDVDHDGSVTLDVTGMGAGTLQFKTGSLDWADFGSTQDITTTGGTGNDYFELVWFRLRDPQDTDGVLTFQGDPEATIDGLDLYNAVIINWSDVVFSLSFASANNNDNVSPVPLPPAAFMFFSGLLGLCGVRRLTKR